MASTYKVALGHDVASLDLDLVDPQPTSDGIQVTRRTFSGNGTVYDQGRYIELRWSVIEDEAEYNDLLQQFGIDGGDLTADVTISVPDDDYQYNRFNGIAVRPQLGQDARRRDYFIREMVIVVRNLEFAL